VRRAAPQLSRTPGLGPAPAAPMQKLKPVPKKGVAILTPTIWLM